MNIPLLSCNKCKLSEKDSFLIPKDSQINNEERYIIEKSLISSKNDNSTNNLEIIDYPYPSNLNTDESFKKNVNNKDDKNNITINNDSFMKIHGLIEQNLNNDLDKNKATLTSSSGIIKNEDSITQNKIILNNLYSNYNNKILTKISLNKNIDNKENKKLDKNKINNIIAKNNDKNLKNIKNKTKKKLNTMSMKLEFIKPITDRFSTKDKNIKESKIIKTKRYKDESTSKIKINTKKTKLSRNKTNIKNNSININKNINFKINLDMLSNNNSDDNNKNAKTKRIGNKKNNKLKLINKQKIKNILNNNLNSVFKKIEKKENVKVKEKYISNNITNIYKTLNFTNKKNLINYTNVSNSNSNRIYLSNVNYTRLLLNRVNLVNYNYKNAFSKSNEKRIKKNKQKIEKMKKTNIIYSRKNYFNPFETNEINIKNSLDFESDRRKTKVNSNKLLYSFAK